MLLNAMCLLSPVSHYNLQLLLHIYIISLLQLKEFRQKMQSFFPAIPKNEEAQENSAPFDWDSIFKSK